VKIQVTLIEERNFGDHGAMMSIAHEVEEGETVEHLVARLMKVGEFQRPYISTNYANHIILRVVEGTADPKPTLTAPF
jgi:hypothetical protein